MRPLFALLLCGCQTPIPGSGWASITTSPTSWDVFAAFDKQAAAPTSCAETVGDCQWLPPGCFGPIAGTNHISVGTLAIDDSDHQLQLMRRDDDGMYKLGGYDGGFQPDDPVRISAPGGAIDGFSGKITMPEKSKLQPVPSPAPRNQDLALAWSGGTDRVLVDVYFQGGEISCSFDAAKKSGEIPSSFLQKVDAGTHGSLSYENEARVDLRPDLSLYANAQRGEFADIELQ